MKILVNIEVIEVAHMVDRVLQLRYPQAEITVTLDTETALALIEEDRDYNLVIAGLELNTGADAKVAFASKAQGIPVIAMITPSIQEREVREVVGPDGIINRPFSLEALYELIDEVLSRRAPSLCPQVAA